MTSAPFQQQATYAQLFWAMREWLVASAIGERLAVQRPFEERYAAGRIELNARLTSQATIGVSGRIQRNLLTSALANAILLQAAFKTVR